MLFFFRKLWSVDDIMVNKMVSKSYDPGSFSSVDHSAVDFDLREVINNIALLAHGLD